MDVIYIHDAAIDEYMSTVLLTTMPGITLRGIVIVNADCIDTAAMQTAWRIQSFIKRTDIPLGLSSARGWNAFPWAYRSDCVREGGIEALAGIPLSSGWPPFPDGDALLEQLLRKAESPVTLLVTGPMTPLATLLQRRPELADKVQQCIWMGGAIDVQGNIDPATVPTPPGNTCAEWNAFWDAGSVDWIFRNTRFPIVQFPLDMTNRAKITDAFMAQLAQQARTAQLSLLASQSYALVRAESFYDMWDVVTTCWLSDQRDAMFAPPTVLTLSCNAELGDCQGCIKRDPNGRAVRVVFDFADDGARFYQYVLQQLNRNA